MASRAEPTDRELGILKILWEKGEATVRQVYEAIREDTTDGDAPIAQNTVQSFLRIMHEKGLVEFRKSGRAFVYRPTDTSSRTGTRMVGRMLDRLFDGAVDQLVQTLFAVRPPSAEEIDRLETIIARIKSGRPADEPKEGA